jgi:hypothetical protein
MSFVVVASVGLGLAAAGGISKAVMGAKQRKKAREEKEVEKAELEKLKAEFAGLDTSNPFANMENVFEDLTVDQRQAQFQKEQAQQSQANILEQMRGAAGGSGIAALAQTLASQSQLQAQQASASIGQQERANQLAQAQQEARLQQQERQGEIMSRQAEGSKLQTMFGMTAEDVATASRAEQAAQAAMYSGIGDVAEAGLSAVSAGVGGIPTE